MLGRSGVVNLFNRVIAVLLWLLLLAVVGYTAIFPHRVIVLMLDLLLQMQESLRVQQAANGINFLIGQLSVGVLAVLIFGSLLWLELWPHRQRGVRVQTVEGGSVELDTDSIARRLSWHLDQLSEVITVIPDVKARGNGVDIELDIETAPDIDVPMKTNEVVEVTQDLLEEDMGLRLGRLDVRIRHAPFEEEWVA